MPRLPSGVYQTPVGTDGIPDTPVLSTPYNFNVHDVETDLNAPRPIVAGGTGATSATQARVNLSAEASGQAVTNYDTFAFESGSFWSGPGATSAPDPTHFWMGESVVNGSNTFLQARALGSGSFPSPQYVRERLSGAWGAWTLDTGTDATRVSKHGDVMDGTLTLAYNNPAIILAKQAAAQKNSIYGYTTGSARWEVVLGNAVAEGGSNAGSNYVIARYNDAGAFIDNPVHILRSSGLVTIPLLQAGASTPGTYAVAVNIGYAGGAATQYGIALRPATDTTTSVIFFNAAGTPVGSITQTAAATAYNTSSDERLKDNLESFQAGNIIDRTDVYSFNWKGGGGERAYGVLAQQANKIYPAAVTYTEEHDWWGIDYSKYVPLLLQEIKDLRARVAALEAAAPLEQRGVY